MRLQVELLDGLYGCFTKWFDLTYHIIENTSTIIYLLSPLNCIINSYRIKAVFTVAKHMYTACVKQML